MAIHVGVLLPENIKRQDINVPCLKNYLSYEYSLHCLQRTPCLHKNTLAFVCLQLDFIVLVTEHIGYLFKMTCAASFQRIKLKNTVAGVFVALDHNGTVL